MFECNFKILEQGNKVKEGVYVNIVNNYCFNSERYKVENVDFRDKGVGCFKLVKNFLFIS